MILRDMTRRRVLKGMLGGAAVSVSLPLLEIFLNDNGTALANGAPLPLRFGTWFWGCGMNPDRFRPEDEGPGYTLSPELESLGELKDQVSVLTGFDTILDGRLNTPHTTGVMALLTGSVPEQDGDVPAPTLDVLISRELGNETRFRSLELSATGVPGETYSRESRSVQNPSAVSPAEVYARIFGANFQDPADSDFIPDPRTLLRQSALSAVKDDVTRLEAVLGSHDRHRLDRFFTSLRQLEKQIDVSLSGPPDLVACSRPGEPGAENIGRDLPQAIATHEMMSDLLVAALLCDQTRVFNMIFSWGLSALRHPGDEISHHERTHDEPVDYDLGYQPLATEFALASIEAWAGFVRKLAATEEGDGSLLDNCLVFAHSESSFAKSHDVTGMPMMIAGAAQGRIVPGVHVAGGGDPVTRAGLTIQQALGLPVARWGTGAMEASRPISEILV